MIIYRKKTKIKEDIINNLNDLEIQVLELLKQNGKSTAEDISGKVGKTPRTIQRAIARLVEKGYIKRVGSNKTGVWSLLN